MSLLYHLGQVITHNQTKLGNKDEDEHDHSSDLDSEDLGVELDQSHPCRAIKSLPCIEHAHRSATTQDLRLDLAGEGTVEGYDGLIFLGHHRGLNTLECYICWNDNKDDGANGDEADKDNLDECHLLHGIWVATVGSWVAELILNSEEERSGYVNGRLTGYSKDSSRDDDVLSCLDGRNAAPPALGAWSRDDDVRPSHLKTAHTNSGEDDDESASERMISSGTEEVDDEAVDSMVDNGDVETPKAGPAATLGLQVLDRCAHLGCDRLLLDKEEIGLHRLHLLGLLFLREKRSINFFEILVGVDLEGCSGGSLDHGQSCDDIAVGIRDLCTSYQRCCRLEEYTIYVDLRQTSSP